MRKLSVITTITFSLLCFIFSFINQDHKHTHTTEKNHNHKHSDFCKVVPTPDAIELKQPNGNVITAFIKGNHIIYRLETEDGYTVQKDSDGFYKYALKGNNGTLAFSSQIAHNLQERNNNEIAFLSTIGKGIKYGEDYKKARYEAHENQMNEMRSANNSSQGGFPTTGQQKTLLLLIDYPDQPFTFDRQGFDNMMNQTNYSVNGASGSFREYYLSASHNQLDISTDVVGWYTAQHNRAAYKSTYTPQDLVREAVDAAENAGIDFSQYDGNNDGKVDVVMVVHSGRGQETSGDTDDIWSHRNRLHSKSVHYDGKKINDYIIQPEKHGINTISNIGVFAHEFGHALNLPDLYDTNGDTNGEGEGAGRWCLMAAGTWNNGGRTPAHPNAWCKEFLGWGNKTILTTPTNVTNLQSWETSGDYFKIPTLNPDEYFLIANRQKNGWDSALPGEGLLIWHINNSIVTSSPISHNRVNANPSSYGVQLEQADNENDLNNNNNRGDLGDPYTGLAGSNAFNCWTSPSSNLTNGNASNININNISINNNLASFAFTKCISNTIDCTNAIDIKCGETVSGSTIGKQNNTNQYSCDFSEQFTGNDMIYRINIETTTTLDINLSGENTDDLNLFLLDGCNNISCIETGDDKINTAVEPGTYYIVVDGKNGTNSDFELSVGYCFCASKGKKSSYEWIDFISIGQWSNNSGNNNGYMNSTNTTLSLNRSKYYPLTLIPGFSNQSYKEYWKIWIDLNKDNDFDDEGELVFDSGSAYKGTVTGGLVLPCNAPLGKTGMRVSMKYKDPQSACETFSYGEVEDYVVEIQDFVNPILIMDSDSEQNYTASSSCTDQDGWTHYFYNEDETDYLLLSIHTDPNESQLNIDPSDVSIRFMETTSNSSDDAASQNTWMTVGPYWFVNIEPENQPSRDVIVRYYFDINSYDDFTDSTDDLIPFKLTGNNDSWESMTIQPENIDLYDENQWEIKSTEDYNYFEISTSHISGGGIILGSPSVISLPIELNVFEGMIVEEQTVLSWQTMTEINASHFEIEYSNDGLNFDYLGSVDAANTKQVNDYQFIHEEPQNGYNYYRLKMIDLDNTYEYSDIINIKFSGKQYFDIYPNPAINTDDISIETTATKDGVVIIKIFDTNGKCALNKSFEVEKGQNQFTIPAKNISKGMYIMHLYQNEDAQEVVKLIIQ